MSAALLLAIVALGALSAGVLVGRYYVPDDRHLRRSARHGRAYLRALGDVLARDADGAIACLREVVEDNVDDPEPYFALGALFRSRGETERAIRIHQALAVRERDRKRLRLRALYELGLDFRAAGMPRRATRAMEEVLAEEDEHEGALRAVSALYEEQGRFGDAAGALRKLAKARREEPGEREHHLRVAAAQAAIARDELDTARHWLKEARDGERESPHASVTAAELSRQRGDLPAARAHLVAALEAEPALALALWPALFAVERAAAEARLAGRSSSAEAMDEASDDPHDTIADPSPESAGAPARDQAVAAPSDADGIARARVDARLRALEARARQHAPGVDDDVLGIEPALARAELWQAQAAASAAAERAISALQEGYATSLPAQVAAARLALARGDREEITASLRALIDEEGPLGRERTGRWACTSCGKTAPRFGWRCAACRRWSTMRWAANGDRVVVAPRERRAERRLVDGSSPMAGLPQAALPATLSAEEIAERDRKRSVLGRAQEWISGVWSGTRGAS